MHLSILKINLVQSRDKLIRIKVCDTGMQYCMTLVKVDLIITTN